MYEDVILAEGQQKMNANIFYSVVYPARTGQHILKTLGRVSLTREGADDTKTLHDLHFETGDYLDLGVCGGGGGWEG